MTFESLLLSLSIFQVFLGKVLPFALSLSFLLQFQGACCNLDYFNRLEFRIDLLCLSSKSLSLHDTNSINLRPEILMNGLDVK